VAIDMYGDKLVEVALDGELNDALLENKGLISAKGGNVVLSANTAKDIVKNVINMDGIIDVSSVSVEGGKIVLSGGKGGTVKVDGVLNASGEKGGGEIKVTGKDIKASKNAYLLADAITEGNGGNVTVLADDKTAFEGNVYARGGAVSGNGGAVEVSAKNQLGYDGTVNTSAVNGLAGSFLLDPLFTVIHSGSLHNLFGLEYILSAQALANDLHRNGSVTVQADEFINVGTDSSLLGNGPIDMSHYNYTQIEVVGYFWGLPIYGLKNYQGITNGLLTLDSKAVNFNKDVTLGQGGLRVAANTVNLDSKIYSTSAGGVVSLANDATINSTAGTINVQSNKAFIQQAVHLAKDSGGTTINVGNGTYNENVNINKSLTLQSKNGRDVTTINGIANGALGTVVIGNNINNVTLGNAGKGFTINGFDNNNPGVENAAVYLQGDHSNITVKGNKIVANGDSALLSEYGRTNSNIVVDGNIFDGKTYVGNTFATGDQFTVPNVPRQLVALNLGLSNTTFTNNTVLGNSGDRQLVAINSVGSNISGNTIDGTTTASVLHVRGSSATISNNTIDGNNIAGTALLASNISGLTISGNTVKDTKDGWNNRGINVSGSQNVVVTGNTIDNAGGHSIYAEGVWGSVTPLDITNNTITNADHNAIYVNKWTGANITGNNITGTSAGNGIQVDLTNNANISGNTIKNAANAGVNLSYGNDGTTIQGNTIEDSKYGISIEVAGNQNNKNIMIGSFTSDPALANTIKGGTTGILSTGAENLWVQGNDVSGASETGINVSNGAGYTFINNNKINATKDGIRLSGTEGLIADNRIGLTSGLTGHGIVVTNASGTDILSNQINNVGKVGIYVNGGSNIDVNDNKLTKIGNQGIYGNQVQTLSLLRNNLDNVNWSGIQIEGGKNLTVQRNKLNNVRGNGVQVSGTNTSDISNNTLTQITGNGINTNGVANSRITNNAITGATIGINTNTGSNLWIEGNDIASASDAGINVTNGGGAYSIINYNKVNSSKDGIRLTGTDGVIGGNKIGLTGAMTGNGIVAKNASGTEIFSNEINDVAKIGISIDGGSNIDVNDNKLTKIGNQGIYGNQVQTLSLLRNNLDNVSWSGVQIEGGSNFTAQRNKLNNVRGNGIQVSGTSTSDISNNTLTDIRVNAINTNGVSNSQILTNTINGAAIGVSTTGGSNLRVESNDISNTSDAGIVVTNGGGSFSIVNFNKINASKDGIRVTGTDAVVAANKIGLTGALTGSGIIATNASGTEILSNEINDVAKMGIYVNGGSNIDVNDNKLTKIGNQGIYGNQVQTLSLLRNNLDNVSWSGIQIEGGKNLTVQRNKLNNVRGNGIQVSGTNTANVFGNQVHDIRLAGIVTNDTAKATVSGNTVYNVGANGISGNNNSNLLIQNNAVGFTNALGTTSGAANNVKGDGIRIANSNGVQITGNKVTETSGTNDVGSGIYVRDSGSAVVEGNTVSNADWDGVKLQGGNGVVVENNTVTNIDRVGIYAANSNNLLVQNNNVQNATFSIGAPYGAITADFGTDVTITGNTVNGSTHGVMINGVGGTSVLSNNTLSGLSNDGVNAKNSGTVEISGNTVTVSNGSGVDVNGNTAATISGNTVNGGANTRGIFASGDANQSVVVSGNTLIDNRVGAEFQSGVIDLTGAGNTINGGEVGLRFAPTAGNASLLSLVDNDGLPNTAYNPAVVPTNFGGTIGAQTFTGQSLYYVELANGAFNTLGVPTWLNGLESSYDGFVPSTLPGNIMTQAQFDTMNGKIWHFPNAATLGLFFFGYVPAPLETADIDERLVFNTFGSFNGNVSGLNIRINGLPNLPGSQGAALNNIQTFAGGSAPATQTFANASDLNNIETAAGGDNNP
ncbi:MAG: hypothetical protein DI626_07220, partial [Micavibrio aeruginosavorus]